MKNELEIPLVLLLLHSTVGYICDPHMLCVCDILLILKRIDSWITSSS